VESNVARKESDNQRLDSSLPLPKQGDLLAEPAKARQAETNEKSNDSDSKAAASQDSEHKSDS
jgi:hypothetical protein